MKSAFTPDRDFEAFLDDNPDKPIYLATDNAETFEKFLKRYPSRILMNNRHLFNPDKYGRRHTDLEASIIDLYLCIGATEFMGSGYSSFTGFINDNRA